ncbi:hypothetical protein VTI74DRAFT_10937 [Chaetomium olivicolor]
MASDFDLGPLPKKITGSCLCGKIAYRIDFPEDHDFLDNSGTCQCTQCRKSTSCLFFVYHKVPYSAVTWTTPTDTLRNYYCSEGNARGFCNQCGSFLYWRREAGPYISIAIGTVDPLYLFGEGWEKSNGEVPQGGYGRALANNCGDHEWTGNEIPGVTDNLEFVGVGPRGRGKRLAE